MQKTFKKITYKFSVKKTTVFSTTQSKFSAVNVPTSINDTDNENDDFYNRNRGTMKPPKITEVSDEPRTLDSKPSKDFLIDYTMRDDNGDLEFD
jgi:hypothetical protein